MSETTVGDDVIQERDRRYREIVRSTDGAEWLVTRDFPRATDCHIQSIVRVSPRFVGDWNRVRDSVDAGIPQWPYKAAQASVALLVISFISIIIPVRLFDLSFISTWPFWVSAAVSLAGIVFFVSKGDACQQRAGAEGTRGKLEILRRENLDDTMVYEGGTLQDKLNKRCVFIGKDESIN